MSTDDARITPRKWPANTYLGSLPPRLGSELISAGSPFTCRAGDMYKIKRECVLLATSGVLLLEYDQRDNSEHAVSTFCGAGELIGVEHALDVVPRYAGSQIGAQVTTQTVIIPAGTFRDFVMKNATAARALIADLAWRYHQEKVHRAWERLPVVESLRLFLEDMARRFGNTTVVRDEVDIEEMQTSVLSINLTQTQMADAIGASTGAVDKALANLRQRGIVTTGYKTLHVKIRVKQQFLSASDLTLGFD